MPELAAESVAGRLSAVVVHYRGGSDLRRCLESLRTQGHPDLEIVVVDNGGDGVALALPAAPDLRRLRMPHNVGFAAGANAGLLAATGQRLLLLNPDAELLPGALTALNDALDAGADLAAPRILLRDDPDRIDNCGHGLYPDGLNWCRGRGAAAAGRYLEPEEILLFSGAAVLLARDALRRSGLLDPVYWAYGEDADLGLRAARLGLRCRYVPGAAVLHAVGGSFGRASLRKALLVERNRSRVAWTHLPVGWLVLSPLHTAARVVAMAGPAAAGTGLADGWTAGQRAMLPGVLAAAWALSLADLPTSLGRRWRLARRVAETPGALSPAAWRARLAGARVGVREIAGRAGA